VDELTAHLQRAATEVAERAVIPAPDDIVRRGRRHRRRQTAAAVLLAIAVAGGVVAVPLLRPGRPAQPGTLAPGHGCSAHATGVRLTARAVAFDKRCLAGVAGEPFTLTFHNQDAVPHNVAIFKGNNASGPVVFRGLPFVDPRTVVYQVPALEPGRYFFHCDVHPMAMQGQLIIR
jgi:plastocyanin